ncbi:winged helix-turn-helix transcriptional regulator [Lentzea flava]|uniref:HxlR family transcriptional regulator n=1 Tax=Lentzea flava TaxID=103732 RepID=A0ABQ2V3J7_9PSEU|nr:transcriptional regulator, HxlR family [Lentzea flava]GGU67385.1 HxlR family transcriptional regulator [Lentzea flava]
MGGVTDVATPEDEHDKFVFDVFAQRCPSRSTLEHLTGKWGTLAMVALYEGTFRFNQLRRRVDGVSEKMLAQTLQALERDGFVHREAQTSIPPKVEYSLTDRGRHTAELLLGLIKDVESQMPDVMAARQRYDAAR